IEHVGVQGEIAVGCELGDQQVPGPDAVVDRLRADEDNGLAVATEGYEGIKENTSGLDVLGVVLARHAGAPSSSPLSLRPPAARAQDSTADRRRPAQRTP